LRKRVAPTWARNTRQSARDEQTRREKLELSMNYPSESPQESPGEPSRGFCHPGLLVLIGSVGVGSLAAAGFLSARWLGFALLGVGCFLLILVIRFVAYD
jgi:hypothetical protein